MKKILSLIIIISFVLCSVFVVAKDVHVKGYYRKDGTYVRPYIRSSPDKSKSNNYGPSKSSYELMHPRTRDYDKDGIPNYLDSDSDNDGIPDDMDSNPYGKNQSGFSIKNNASNHPISKKEGKSSNVNDSEKRDISPLRKMNKSKKEFIVYFKNGKRLICDKAWEDGSTIFLVMHEKRFAIGYQRNEIDMKRSFNLTE